jgi:predicted DNA-binding antitoxin AbrB/MazE fold protein
MITLDFRMEKIGKEYMINLIQLKEGEKIKIIGFENREKLREFVTRMLSPEKLREQNYLTLINDQKLSYTIERIK